MPNSFPAFGVGVSPRGRAGAVGGVPPAPARSSVLFVLLFRLYLPSVSINSFPRGSGCVWLCGNGERSHSPDAGSAQGSSRDAGWVWWEGGCLLTRRLFPPATSTAQTSKIWGLQGEEAASFPAPPTAAFPHLKGQQEQIQMRNRRWMYPFSPFGSLGGLCVV